MWQRDRKSPDRVCPILRRAAVSSCYTSNNPMAHRWRALCNIAKVMHIAADSSTLSDDSMKG
jgi:hypothetical protein